MGLEKCTLSARMSISVLVCQTHLHKSQALFCAISKAIKTSTRGINFSTQMREMQSVM